MKKIKWTIMTLAILASIGGALATRPHYDCTASQQFYRNGSIYLPAGVFGVDYICVLSDSACSYTLVNGVYKPCRLGAYVAILANRPSGK